MCPGLKNSFLGPQSWGGHEAWTDIKEKVPGDNRLFFSTIMMTIVQNIKPWWLGQPLAEVLLLTASLSKALH